MEENEEPDGDYAEARKVGRKTLRVPAEPGDDHTQYFNEAIDDLLTKMKNNDEPGGDFGLMFEITVNPGSIKEYRVVRNP